MNNNGRDGFAGNRPLVGRSNRPKRSDRVLGGSRQVKQEDGSGVYKPTMSGNLSRYEKKVKIAPKIEKKDEGSSSNIQTDAEDIFKKLVDYTDTDPRRKMHKSKVQGEDAIVEKLKEKDLKNFKNDLITFLYDAASKNFHLSDEEMEQIRALSDDQKKLDQFKISNKTLFDKIHSYLLDNRISGESIKDLTGEKENIFVKESDITIEKFLSDLEPVEDDNMIGEEFKTQVKGILDQAFLDKFGFVDKTYETLKELKKENKNFSVTEMDGVYAVDINNYFTDKIKLDELSTERKEYFVAERNKKIEEFYDSIVVEEHDPTPKIDPTLKNSKIDNQIKKLREKRAELLSKRPSWYKFWSAEEKRKIDTKIQKIDRQIYDLQDIQEKNPDKDVQEYDLDKMDNEVNGLSPRILKATYKDEKSDFNNAVKKSVDKQREDAKKEWKKLSDQKEGIERKLKDPSLDSKERSKLLEDLSKKKEEIKIQKRQDRKYLLEEARRARGFGKAYLIAREQVKNPSTYAKGLWYGLLGAGITALGIIPGGAGLAGIGMAAIKGGLVGGVGKATIGMRERYLDNRDSGKDNKSEGVYNLKKIGTDALIGGTVGAVAGAAAKGIYEMFNTSAHAAGGTGTKPEPIINKDNDYIKMMRDATNSVAHHELTLNPAQIKEHIMNVLNGKGGRICDIVRPDFNIVMERMDNTEILFRKVFHNFGPFAELNPHQKLEFIRNLEGNLFQHHHSPRFVARLMDALNINPNSGVGRSILRTGSFHGLDLDQVIHKGTFNVKKLLAAIESEHITSHHKAMNIIVRAVQHAHEVK